MFRKIFAVLATAGLVGTAMAQDPGTAAAPPADAPAADAPPAAEEPAATANADADGVLANELDKLSYAMGFDFGSGMQRQDINFNPDVFMLGVTHSRGEASDALLGPDEVRETLMAFQQQLRAKQAERQAQQATENIVLAEEFLTNAKAEEGVQVTESGLAYKVTEPGAGAKPTLSDRVTVHYTGKLSNGTVFDSSVEKGVPATFGLQGVIPGWTEGLQLMSEGSKYTFYIPPALGYGERGVPGRIPPNSALVFDVELLKIENAQPATPPPGLGGSGSKQ